MANILPAQPITLRQHVSYICSRLISYSLPLIYFLVCISFYLKTYDSAQVKITFVQIGTAILLFIWLVRILVDGRMPFRKVDMIYVAPFIAYLLSGFISFFNSPFRMWPLEEALRRFFYMILAIITISELRSEERMRRLWRWLLAAAAVSIGYGLIQYFDGRLFQGTNGIDPFIWRQAFGSRVFSTFGNPNFYGNFLVIITPLLLASILRMKGSLSRPFLMLGITMGLIVFIDKMTINGFGGYDESYRIVYGAVILGLLILFVYYSVKHTAHSGSLTFFLILFSVLFLNLYCTGTKGAWLGYMAAVAITMWLIFEYFLHPEEHLIEAKKYLLIIGTLVVCYALTLFLMFKAFIIPFLNDEVAQIGFSILPIPVVIAAIVSIGITFWMFRRPWNLKKIIKVDLLSWLPYEF